MEHLLIKLNSYQNQWIDNIKSIRESTDIKYIQMCINHAYVLQKRIEELQKEIIEIKTKKSKPEQNKDFVLIHCIAFYGGEVFLLKKSN